MSHFPPIGSSIIELEEIDSTNDYAMQLSSAGLADHGTVVIAEHQTKGKGQQGNNWQSKPKKNMLFSIILNTTKEDLQSQFLLNASFCCAITNLLTDEFGIKDTCIKWPNDIFIGKNKIAGILIENVIRGQQWVNAIVGIGLNVNQTTFHDTIRATSLINETGNVQKINDLRKIIFKCLNRAYQTYLINRVSILANYNAQLYGIDENIQFIKDNLEKTDVLKGAGEQGLLQIGNQHYRHGEIKLLV